MTQRFLAQKFASLLFFFGLSMILQGLEGVERFLKVFAGFCRGGLHGWVLTGHE